MRDRLTIIFSVPLLLLFAFHTIQNPPEKLLVPIGGDSSDETLSRFVTQAANRAVNNSINILIMPIGLADDPYNISDKQRENYLKITTLLRQQLEAVCRQVAPVGLNCEVAISPVFVRSDAEMPDSLRYLNDSLSGVYIFGDDPSIAVQVISSTPVESRLLGAYQKGVVIGGTDAGAALFSSTVIAGYNPGYSSETALDFGSTAVLEPPGLHGFPFGLKNTVILPRFFDENRAGMLMNAILQPDIPHVGIGIDTNSGILIVEDNLIQDGFGESPIAVVDSESFHSFDSVEYQGVNNHLRARNLLFHLVGASPFSFNLSNRAHSLAPIPPVVQRDFNEIVLPPGAGPLIIAGGLESKDFRQKILTHFANASGGYHANILILAAGYSTTEDALEVAESYKQALNIPAQVLISPIQASGSIPVPNNITGIIFVSENPTTLQPGNFETVKEKWLNGIPLLTDRGASAFIGAAYSNYYSAMEKKPNPGKTQNNPLTQNGVHFFPGLNLLPALFEPGLIIENRWKDLIALAYYYPNLLSLGINRDSAIEISERGAQVLGESQAVTLDLTQATLATDDQGNLVIANGIIDIFTPGDYLIPETADTNAAPIRINTPDIITASGPTPTTTSTPEWTAIPTIQSQSTINQPKIKNPTRTPRPTTVPPRVPPPTDPKLLNLIILFGLLIIIVVLLALWLNHRRLNMR